MPGGVCEDAADAGAVAAGAGDATGDRAVAGRGRACDALDDAELTVRSRCCPCVAGAEPCCGRAAGVGHGTNGALGPPSRPIAATTMMTSSRTAAATASNRTQALRRPAESLNTPGLSVTAGAQVVS